MTCDAEIAKLLKDAIAARGRGDTREAVRILRVVIARIERQASEKRQ
jgi:hypothetical protein